ncbi:aminotransferase class I/II-fold pyridoxal phosphate-dependent enzyme [Pseudoneobacillus sp. C159]
MKQQKVPLFEALRQHHQRKPVSFHVPGHKNGHIFNEEAFKYYRHVLSIDVTELSGLDDLHAPDGVIKEAQDLLTDAYQTKESFFLINGSTVGNLTMILACFKEDETVFVQRNCHKSILNGLKLAKANPVFIEPEFDSEWKVATGIDINSLKSAYQDFPDAKGIILTYPNYYGHTYNIETIIDFCHANDMVVLVDEAHGAHFIAGSPFPASSLQYGADIVVQSAHKTLPAMTMAAFLHVNSEQIPINKVHSLLQILQSSSPSYPIMASLDLARNYIATYDSEDKSHLISQLQEFILGIQQIPTIKVLYHTTEGDPLKIVIQSTIGLSGYELQEKLQSVGIDSELADPYNVLLVFPLLKKPAVFNQDEVLQSIKATLESATSNNLVNPPSYIRRNQAYSSLKMKYRNQEDTAIIAIPFTDSIDKVSAEMIIPYPPGIPLLMEGEAITATKLEELQQLRSLGAKFHGGSCLSEGKINVFE